jgi:hypothetical protein
MNKEQQELLGEVYNDYLKNGHQEEGRNKDITFLPLPKNWFIEKIITNPDFAKQCGVTIYTVVEGKDVRRTGINYNDKTIESYE